MRCKRFTPFVIAMACALATGLATADPATLSGRWTERWEVFKKKTASFELTAVSTGVWQTEVRSPRNGEPRRLTLRHVPSGWQLTVERRVQANGVEDVIAGTSGGWAWGSPAGAVLTRKGDQLEGNGFSITLPASASTATPGVNGGAGGALGDTSPAGLPIIRVLITGFDRFPRPVNHPSWHNYSGERMPQINPSGWAVRNFDPLSIDPALRKRARIEVHRLNDVPVLYVEGARAIVNRIQALDADVAISFGVGADGGVDADVESQCSNIMHDGSGFTDEGPGPFQLPASWPPTTPQDSWSAEDTAWLWRYPDNGGVSYNRKKIDPALPDTLRSSLPVDKIVARAEREGLRAHSGMSGPGQYICNNVMFKVVDAQAKRGKLGGFIHMKGWSESSRESYLKVLRCAIEESVRAVLDKPTN